MSRCEPHEDRTCICVIFLDYLYAKYVQFLTHRYSVNNQCAIVANECHQELKCNVTSKTSFFKLHHTQNPTGSFLVIITQEALPCLYFSFRLAMSLV